VTGSRAPASTNFSKTSPSRSQPRDTTERASTGRERTVWFARPDIIMRVTHLDAKTGSFTLVQVPLGAAEAA
jgi:hypothetical protein